MAAIARAAARSEPIARTLPASVSQGRVSSRPGVSTTARRTPKGRPAAAGASQADSMSTATAPWACRRSRSGPRARRSTLARDRSGREPVALEDGQQLPEGPARDDRPGRVADLARDDQPARLLVGLERAAEADHEQDASGLSGQSPGGSARPPGPKSAPANDQARRGRTHDEPLQGERRDEQRRLTHRALPPLRSAGAARRSGDTLELGLLAGEPSQGARGRRVAAEDGSLEGRGPARGGPAAGEQKPAMGVVAPGRSGPTPGTARKVAACSRVTKKLSRRA